MTASEKHAHGEAFALMQYECKQCRSVEIIWNSRDGVTPFGVDCRACGGEAMHARWNEDIYAPNHVPALGTRMFVDLTQDRARAAGLRNARRFWDHPDYPAREQYSSIEAFAELLAKSYLEQPGAPDLVVVSG